MINAWCFYPLWFGSCAVGGILYFRTDKIWNQVGDITVGRSMRVFPRIINWDSKTLSENRQHHCLWHSDKKGLRGKQYCIFLPAFIPWKSVIILCYCQSTIERLWQQNPVLSAFQHRPESNSSPAFIHTFSSR